MYTEPCFQHLKKKCLDLEKPDLRMLHHNINMATLSYQSFQEPQMSLPMPWSISEQTQPTSVFCIACEHKFPDKTSLEDHACPAVSFICSCGMGYTDYAQMLLHRNTHSDTTALQSDHVSIMKKRNQGARLGEMKLRMLKSIDRELQHAQKRNLLMPFTAQMKYAPPVIPALNLLAPPTLSAAPTMIGLPPPVSSSYAPYRRKSYSSKNMPSTARPMPTAAPGVPQSCATGNLTRQFQPVVLLRTKQLFHAGGPYMCATCRVIFWAKKLLVEHIVSHSLTHIHGCWRCGLLLLGNTPLPSRHSCGAYYASNRDRFTIGHFVCDVSTDQKQLSVSRCPHCPAAFYQPWHLQRHVRSRHMDKDVFNVFFPQIEMDKGKTQIKAQQALAPVSYGQAIRMSQQQPVRKITEMPGWNLMNGMVKHTTGQPDRKILQQTIASMLMTGRNVAETGALKVAETRVEDLKQQGTKAVGIVPEEQTLNQMSCAMCGKNVKTIQLLGQHWCNRKLTLLRQDELQSMPLKCTGAYRGSLGRSSPYPLVGRDSDGMVTLRLQTSHDTETCEPILKNIKAEPIELSCTALMKSVAVQTKAEYDDGSYDAAIHSSTASSCPNRSLTVEEQLDSKDNLVKTICEV
ncbi:uncharacterized protein LOC134082871 [Sardina pilchardus]|uniref:uncharacterized protein LOC134082871 n=1 Tax=Sardina pilchardus TaxID=27697 RepID=UPI002E14F541